MLVWIVFGGYYVNQSDVPRVLRWLPTASLIKQGFQVWAGWGPGAGRQGQGGGTGQGQGGGRKEVRTRGQGQRGRQGQGGARWSSLAVSLAVSGDERSPGEGLYLLYLTYPVRLS